MILFLIVFLTMTLNAMENSDKYLFTEMFEDKKSIPIKFWATNLDKNRDIDIVYSIDKKSFSEGEGSLKLIIDSKGFPDATKEWYYYLEIPLKPIPNLKNKLSFSIDVKMDKHAANNIQVGFNLQYRPLSTGVYAFDKLNYKDYNRWTTIRSDDLGKLLTTKHANYFISNIYKAKLDSFGRTISNVLILIKGRGKQKYEINLDNLRLEGKIMPIVDFNTQSKKSWLKYITNVRRDIKEKKILYTKLLKKSNIKSNSKEKIEYQKKIETIFKEIDNILAKNKILKISKVEQLDFYLRRLKSLYTSVEINAYKIPAMKYYRLNGYNTPLLDRVKSFNLKMTENEYKSIAVLLEAGSKYGKYHVDFSDFKGEQGSFSKDNLDVYIAKIWYQSGRNSTLKTGKYLTQELLLKDETLVKVDYKSKSNYLRVKQNRDNAIEYIKISDALDKFPPEDSITFNDSKTLQPFVLDAIRHKLLWGIVHVPKGTKEGVYISQFTIKNSKEEVVLSFPIRVDVLPFTLDAPKVSYSLYYTGKLTNSKVKPLDSYSKSEKQQELELKDMKAHGVMYPTSYEKLEQLEKTLILREKVGLPKDRFYTLGFNVMAPDLVKKINAYQKILSKYGYEKNSLFVYGIDEAPAEELKKEKIFMQKVHKNHAKTFVAGYGYTYKYLGSTLDVFNYAEGITKKDTQEQVKNWHKQGKEIFVYASPQVGIENPEIYRRNFGCRLWKKGFDGAMNWAYQAHRGAFWNDFDQFVKYPSPYREEAFTYPTTDGIIGTIQWEGFREAITDVRYISTLENLRDRLKSKGKDTSKLDSWIKSIDCNGDLDKLREDIIDKILEYREMSIDELH